MHESLANIYFGNHSFLLKNLSTCSCPMILPIFSHCISYFIFVFICATLKWDTQWGKQPLCSLFGGWFDWNSCVFIWVKRHSVKSESEFQIKGRREWGRGGEVGEILLISYLWIYLDARECRCADFKHYLILQTSLLMCARSEADCRALAKWRLERRLYAHDCELSKTCWKLHLG